jgi:transposase
MKAPPPLQATEAQLQAILTRIRSGSLQQEDYPILAGALETMCFLSRQLQEKNFSIQRLRQMLFGAGTEKTAAVLNRTPSDPASNATGRGAPKGKRPGHGRRAGAAYWGLKPVKVSHAQLKVGDRCPDCGKGKLYDTARPAVLLHLQAQPIIDGTRWELEKLRCALCGQLFSATPPPEAGEEKYAANVAPMLAVMRYGYGMPMNRIAQLQQDCGVPLPTGTQWELMQEHARELVPLWEEFQRQAADGEVVYNDDTTARILSLEKEIRAAEKLAAQGAPKLRTGIFTTGLLAQRGPHTLALFFSGGQHAGENLQDVLDRRSPGLPPPIQMCDGLSRNRPRTTPTRLANCTAHGRRGFVTVAAAFPQECAHVLDIIRKVYQHDQQCRRHSLSDEQRLRFHQEHSAPLMADLQPWMEGKLQRHEVEPNSSLGEAITYMLKRWGPLTLFLREPGAPLDNNIVERALKTSIRHRNNSLFYKTQNGAHVGDLFMSLTHTCRLARVNPFDYLATLRRHLPQVRDGPAAWMPWNYQTTAATLAASHN